MPIRLLTLALPLLLLAAAPARAEEDETRITAAAQTVALSARALGTSASVLAYGGRLSIADGLNRWIEVGLDLSALTQPAVSLARPMTSGASGGDLIAYAGLHQLTAGATVRYLVGASAVRHFARLHPTFELGAGLLLRRITAASVFTEDGRAVTTLPAEDAAAPFASASAGFTFRAGDRLQLGLLTTALVSAPSRSIGLSFELSWQRDTLL